MSQQRVHHIASLIIKEAKERLKSGYTPNDYVSRLYSVSLEVDAIIVKDMARIREEGRKKNDTD